MQIEYLFITLLLVLLCRLFSVSFLLEKSQFWHYISRYRGPHPGSPNKTNDTRLLQDDPAHNSKQRYPTKGTRPHTSTTAAPKAATINATAKHQIQQG